MHIPTATSTAAAVLGRRGGQSKSKAKTKASRANGAKGGRPIKIDYIELNYSAVPWMSMPQLILRDQERTKFLKGHLRQSNIRKKHPEYRDTLLHYRTQMMYERKLVREAIKNAIKVRTQRASNPPRPQPYDPKKVGFVVVGGRGPGDLLN